MVVICRYGELFLKGDNRSFFEDTLVQNIRSFMDKHHITGKICAIRNRILIETNEPCPFLSFVFGLTSYSMAQRAEPNLVSLAVSACRLLQSHQFSSFRVAAQRLAKNYPFTSHDINVFVGDAVVDAFHTAVDLEHPDIAVGIELMDDTAYVFLDTSAAPGGLPVGVSGEVAVLFDCPEAEFAALFMMKRGCTPIAVGFEEPSYQFLPRFFTSSIPFERIYTLSDVSSIAAHYSSPALVVGYVSFDALDLNNIISIPILSPLIGMNHKEINHFIPLHETLH